MRRFVWIDTQGVVDDKLEEKCHSLLEVFEKDKIQFWGVIRKDGDIYRVAVFSKERILQTTIEEIPSIKEAKEAITEFLNEEGIITEGDEIRHEQTE